MTFTHNRELKLSTLAATLALPLVGSHPATAEVPQLEREFPGDDPCSDCLYRHAVCGSETLNRDWPQNPRKARYLAGFCISGFSLTVTGRRRLCAGYPGFL